MDILVTKLPSEVQSRWGRQIVKNHPVSQTLQDFASWFSKFVKGKAQSGFSDTNHASKTEKRIKTGPAARQQIRFFTDYKRSHASSDLRRIIIFKNEDGAASGGAFKEAYLPPMQRRPPPGRVQDFR
ncbi:hypothetical protein DAPPUDRAFT_261559 [Daphnia pulex]|uniref:Uncharacterized protein n=1 Tax=Daphnia pulex TaxID=6669 RepID=E9HL76_DAPPU|nr:hypothetical protein DAPPUDRAFT_261559 [Daphnia pulex]|eukprot:EFX67510.1 hypothetical protein DAPPUDRAFT_261559 [Daphnia pulex]